MSEQLNEKKLSCALAIEVFCVGLTLAFRFIATVSPFHFAVSFRRFVVAHHLLPMPRFSRFSRRRLLPYSTVLLVVLEYNQCCNEGGGLDQKMIEGLERAFSNPRFWVNSTRHHSRYGSYYPRKSEFATGLVFKRNSGCLKKYGGGSSLPRIYG